MQVYDTTSQFSYAREQANSQRERAEVKRQATPLLEIQLPNVTRRQIEKNIAILILKSLAKETA